MVEMTTLGRGAGTGAGAGAPGARFSHGRPRLTSVSSSSVSSRLPMPPKGIDPNGRTTLSVGLASGAAGALSAADDLGCAIKAGVVDEEGASVMAAELSGDSVGVLSVSGATKLDSEEADEEVVDDSIWE